MFGARNGRRGGAGGKASPTWTLLLTSVAFFIVAMDALVVTTALPAIQRDLHAGVSTLEWTVNAYSLTYAAAIVTAAGLGDRLGPGAYSSRDWRFSPSPQPRVRSRPTLAFCSPQGRSRGLAPRPSCPSASRSSRPPFHRSAGAL